MRQVARLSFFCLALLFGSLGWKGQASAQEVDVTPASFDFGNVVVNDTAGPQLFTLTNTDATTLNVATVSLATAAQFSITSNTCNGAVLITAATCTFEVEFSPDAATPFSDTVNIVSDDPSGPETVDLDGTGVEPVASISPTSLTFADQVVGTTSVVQTVTVENTGTSDLNVSAVTVTAGTDFAIDNETCTGGPIAPLGTCTIDVEFSPTATGPLNDDIQIVSDAASSPDTVTLDGTGVQPAVSIAPPSLSFGSIPVGNSSPPQALTVTNSGTSDLNVSAVALLTGTDFSIDSETCTGAPVAPTASCAVNVVFSPTSAALLSDTVQITSDAPTSIDSAAVSGTGVQGAIANVSPATLDFGNVGVGLTSPALTAQLTNGGNEPLVITGAPAIVGNPDFVLVNETCSDAAVLQPGEDCLAEVQYSPVAVGASLGGTLEFSTDLGTSSVVLAGDGVVGPIAGASPTTLDFGTVGVGNSSSSLSAQLTNTGTTLLTITAAAVITGADLADFTIANDTCGTGTLQPGQSCLVEVVYSPTAVATDSASLDFATDGGSPSVALTGDGDEGPVATASHVTLNFGTVEVGSSSAPQAVRLTNTGSDDLTLVNAAVLSGAGVGEYEIVSDTCLTDVLEPGEDCTVEIVYTPTVAGPAPAASLNFDSDANDPSVSLVGVGSFFANAVVAPTSLAFGNVAVGQSSAPLNVQLTNDGITTLVLTAAPALSGAGAGEYAILNDGCGTASLSAHESCIVQIVYTPTAAGPAGTANLNFTTNANDPAVPLTGTGVDGALASVSPTTLAFGSAGVGTPSQPRIVQLTNIGTADLTLASAPALSGAGAAEYAIVGDTCGTSTLQPNEDCIVEIVYTPVTVGAAPPASLDFDTDANDLSVSITGTGTFNGSAGVSPSSLAFGAVPLGQSSEALNVQLTNTGTTDVTLTAAPVLSGPNATEYAIVNDGCGTASLRPAESCIVQVVFEPTVAGPAIASLDFTTDSNDPTVPLSGTGSTGPVASLSPDLDFGNQAVGSVSAPRIVQLTNVGTTPLTFNSVGVNGANAGEFLILSESCTDASPLPPSTDCLVEVQFAPTTAAAAVASLDFSTDGGGVSAALNGVGVTGPNAVAAPATLDFGNVAVGATAGPLTAQLTNTGTTPLTLTAAPALTGSADFAIVSTTCDILVPLNPGEDCLVELSYSPAAAGVAAATSLDFTTDGGNPSVDVTGVGVIGPIATVNNPALAFGNQAVGSSSQARVVQLTNTGTTVLTVSSVALGGANPGEFEIANETCTAFGTLGVGETCIVEVLFAPTTAALSAATLDFTTDGGNPSATLSGTGVDAGLSANTPIFPDTLIDTASAEQTVTVSNAVGASSATLGQVGLSGADPDAFTITEDNCSFVVLAGGGSCTIGITFEPDAVATFNANLDVPSNASGGPLTVALTGDGVAGALTVSPASPFDFGDVPVNDPPSAGVQVFTLSNVTADPSGNITLGTISLVGADPDQFAITQDACSNTILAFGTSCDVEVTFAPDAAGPLQASLSIPSNSPGQAVVVHDIEGTGVNAALGVSPGSPFDFGNVQVGDESPPQTFTVTNLSAAPLNLGVISIIGDDPSNFTIVEDNCSSTILASAATCQFQVVFLPNDDDNFTATASIPSNDPASPFSLSLLGAGVVPGLNANPVSLSFGNQVVGESSAAQTVTLSNVGTANVVILSADVVGNNPDDFEIVQDGCSGQTLIPLGTCVVRGVFSPESTGAKSANLLVVSGDESNPFVSVPWSGTGIAPGGSPQLSLSPSVLDFDNVQVNASKVQNVTLTNVGQGSLAVSAVEIEGVNPSSFSTTGDCSGATLAPGESCSQAVTFAPSSQDDFNAVLSFTTNDPTTPSFVALIGSSIFPDIDGDGGCSLALGREPGRGRGWIPFAALGLALATAFRWRARRS